MLCVGLFIGLVVGRWYQHAKDRYPENQEIIRGKEAKARALRAKYEAEEERYRREIDKSLDARSR
jgi:hypothetical protein